MRIRSFEHDEREIAELVNGLEVGQNRRDAARFDACFTADALFVTALRHQAAGLG